MNGGATDCGKARLHLSWHPHQPPRRRRSRSARSSLRALRELRALCERPTWAGARNSWFHHGCCAGRVRCRRP